MAWRHNRRSLSEIKSNDDHRSFVARKEAQNNKSRTNQGQTHVSDYSLPLHFGTSNKFFRCIKFGHKQSKSRDPCRTFLSDLRWSKSN